MDLKKQVAQGAIWAFMDQFGVQFISFLVNLILARLLMPADFGTIALFNVVINISYLLVNGGLSSSLIRTQTITDRDLSTVFWFNIGMTLLLYLLIFLSAPFIATFYHMPQLTTIVRVYSIVLIIDSFVNVQSVILQKNLDFKTTFKVRLPAMIVGGLCGLGFALTGFGVWSLVYSVLIQNLLSTFQYWFYSDWRPSFVFDMEKFKYHFAFGWRIALSAILNGFFSNIYTIVIGKRFSETTLGFYNRAESLKNLPINNISTALNKVTYPVFARFSNDDEKLRNAYRKLLKLVIFIVAPLICMMVIAAEPLVRFLLGEKWLPIVPYFQIMAIGGLFQPIHFYNLNLLQVKGRADLYLRLEIIKKFLIVAAVFVGLAYGVYGILWAEVAISVISLFINTFYTAKFIRYSMGQQLADLLPSIAISCILALVVWLGSSFLPSHLSDWGYLIIMGGGYVLSFWAICSLIQFGEYVTIKDMLMRRFVKRNVI
ncbi:lipopolysaccharide biosynthesis protein [Sphingobacterium kitahiroshimense]|uniref:Lipopolysaccharide biosynthesis protein n=1 Tax=Sphingobacterium kitahiroshimense TaxID=470446 RepID=A0ABV0C011_9SPHI